MTADLRRAPFIIEDCRYEEASAIALVSIATSLEKIAASITVKTGVCVDCFHSWDLHRDGSGCTATIPGPKRCPCTEGRLL